MNDQISSFTSSIATARYFHKICLTTESRKKLERIQFMSNKYRMTHIWTSGSGAHDSSADPDPTWILKEIVALVWVWQKGVLLVSANMEKNRWEFLNFPQLLRLLINVTTRNTALQRKGMEIATFLPIASGRVCLLSYWLMDVIWAFPSRGTIHHLRIAWRLSNILLTFHSGFFNTLSAVPSGCPMGKT
jgi:hypothetical protein